MSASACALSQALSPGLSHLVVCEGAIEERLEVARVQRQRRVVGLDRAAQVPPLAQRVSPGVVRIGRPERTTGPVSVLCLPLLPQCVGKALKGLRLLPVTG